MDKRLKKFLVNTITIQKPNGMNSEREQTYATGKTAKAKVEYRVTTLKDSSGKEINSKTRMFVDETVDVGMEYLITLPDGEKRQVIAVITKWGLKGNIDHRVVFV